MPKLFIILDQCVSNEINGEKIDCPFAESERTQGAGYAMDYYCKLSPDPKAKHGYKMTSGYVEWNSDINPVPHWCPIMCVEDRTLKILEK